MAIARNQAMIHSEDDIASAGWIRRKGNLALVTLSLTQTIYQNFNCIEQWNKKSCTSVKLCLLQFQQSSTQGLPVPPVQLPTMKKAVEFPPPSVPIHLFMDFSIYDSWSLSMFSFFQIRNISKIVKGHNSSCALKFPPHNWNCGLSRFPPLTCKPRRHAMAARLGVVGMLHVDQFFTMSSAPVIQAIGANASVIHEFQTAVAAWRCHRSEQVNNFPPPFRCWPAI